jgi:hypothetical protein
VDRSGPDSLSLGVTRPLKCYQRRTSRSISSLRRSCTEPARALLTMGTPKSEAFACIQAVVSGHTSIVATSLDISSTNQGCRVQDRKPVRLSTSSLEDCLYHAAEDECSRALLAQHVNLTVEDAQQGSRPAFINIAGVDRPNTSRVANSLTHLSGGRSNTTSAYLKSGSKRTKGLFETGGTCEVNIPHDIGTSYSQDMGFRVSDVPARGTKEHPGSCGTRVPRNRRAHEITSSIRANATSVQAWESTSGLTQLTPYTQLQSRGEPRGRGLLILYRQSKQQGDQKNLLSK